MGRKAAIRIRRGFTIAESMISMLILALLISTFGAVYPYTAQSIVRAKHMDQAVSACQQQLEYWRDAGYASCPAIAAGYSSTSSTFTPPSDLSNPTGTTTFTHLDSNFSATTIKTGRLRLDATITWTGHGADRGTVTLSTMIHE